MTVTVTNAVERLKGIFLDMPGTQLSLADAARLTGLEPTVCLAVLEALEDARFLARARNGSFVHRSADSPLT